MDQCTSKKWIQRFSVFVFASVPYNVFQKFFFVVFRFHWFNGSRYFQQKHEINLVLKSLEIHRKQLVSFLLQGWSYTDFFLFFKDFINPK